MRLFIQTLSAALSAFFGAAAAFAQSGDRLALLIGNERYPSEVGALSRPHEDVAELASALETAGFTVTALNDADREAIIDAVDQFSAALDEGGEETIGFFYYAGHGASADVAGLRRNFLLPAGATITDERQLQLRGVRLDEIIGALSSTSAGAVFVVSDACRNTLQWSGARGPDRGFVVEGRRNGLFIAHATAEGATAPDDGAFASALATRLVEPGTFAERAFTLAFRDVRETRESYRLPTISGALVSDFCFISCPDTDAVGRSESAPDLVAFGAAILVNDVAAYETFLSEFPDSAFADDARTRLSALAGGDADAPAQEAEAPPDEPVDPAVDDEDVDRVRAAQTALAAMGYAPGPADGRLGARTRLALEAFSRDAGFIVEPPINAGDVGALREARAAGRRATTSQTNTAEAGPSSGRQEMAARLRQRCDESREGAACTEFAVQFASSEAQQVEYFAAACELNHAAGCARFGLANQFGLGGLEVDLRGARSFYELACENDDAFGCAQLGDMYRTGEGAPADAAQAVAYFRRAIALDPEGSTIAASRLETLSAEP